MAQNITLLGASYSDVPAVTLPKTGGGTARFTDTSGTTATESDVSAGAVFIKADGSQGTGTFDLFGLTWGQLMAKSSAGVYALTVEELLES